MADEIIESLGEVNTGSERSRLREAGIMPTSGWGESQKRVIRKLIKESITTSEVPELLRTAFNTKLLDGYTEHVALWPQVFDQIVLTKGKAVDLPNLKGIHVYEKTPGAENDFTSPTSGEAKMQSRTFECLLGFDEDALEDAEVDLMGWCLRMVGHRFKQKEDYQAFSAFGTRQAAMNTIVNTGLNATAIAEALAVLMNRTVTANSRAEREPITADVLICDPTHLLAAKEILDTSLTVVNNTAGTMAAGGSNVFENILGLIVSPYIGTDYYYIGKRKIFGGSLFMRRKILSVKNWEDLLRDSKNVRAKARFDADIVEPDKWVSIAYS